MDFLRRARLSPLESMVHTCTNSDPWGPHGKDLSELAARTHAVEDRRLILDLLWRRLGERPENWRCVYKSLSVIEFLLLQGSEAVVAELRSSARRVVELSNFHFKDAEGKDQGINVRVKSGTLAAVRRPPALTPCLAHPRTAHGGLGQSRGGARKGAC